MLFLNVGAYVWLGGTILLWGTAAASYLLFRHRLRFAIKLSEGVYETDLIDSPCVVGLFAPRVYLLPNLTAQQREHILLHEQMHGKYLDQLWKLLSYGIISLHWFNPALWLLFRYFQEELEKACDERVLAKIGAERKEDYSESLLALASGKRHGLPSLISFGQGNTKSRIKRILSYRRPLAIVTVLVGIAAFLVCVTLFTTPRAEEGLSSGRTAADDSTSVADSKTVDGSMAETGNSDTNMADYGNGYAANSSNAANATSTANGTNAASGNGMTAGISGLNTENGSDIYQTIGTDDGVFYQACRDGIYRITSEGTDTKQELIYKGFPGVNPQMTCFEGKLYFLTDKYYSENALDWDNNTVRWVNLRTLETGDVPLEEENRSLSGFTLRDGILIVHYYGEEPGTLSSFQAMMLWAEGETVMNGKGIAELTDAEAQQFGLQATQAIQQNHSALYNVSHRIRNRNMAYLDMDGDGKAEKIVLEPSAETKPDTAPDEPLRYYRLQIGDDALEGYGYSMANTVFAFQLNGQMLLALYEDGPSADPCTYFYRYENGNIKEAGSIETDIRRCSISSDGIIRGSLWKEIVQTDFIEVCWRLEDGILTEIPQETYDFLSGNSVELLEALPLHEDIGSSGTFLIQPQQVIFLKTTADWEWILLKAQDGSQGWVHIQDFEVVELRKNVMDVFAGRYMAG
nr:M56 family metallopeptidase [uncultured Acetatifactor sp.]